MANTYCQHARAFHNGMQVVFVHKPSGTLIATDLIWNYPGSGTPKGTQAWKFGMDRVYLPFYKRFMIKDKGNCDIFHTHCVCLQQLITPAIGYGSAWSWSAVQREQLCADCKQQ